MEQFPSKYSVYMVYMFRNNVALKSKKYQTCSITWCRPITYFGETIFHTFYWISGYFIKLSTVSLHFVGTLNFFQLKYPFLGTVYPNYPSFSDNYLLSRIIPEVPAGTQIGWHMCDMRLPLPIQLCLLVANRHPQD